MTYHLETLGDERFQQLCQSILTQVYPNVQCLPVGQRDGGRDAFARRSRKGGKRRAETQLHIFQVKYVRNPETREARDLIESVIKTEKSKVEKLLQDGASAYYLLTNVPGTSYLEHGSIDKVNAELSSAFAIESYCWWRDDIERRIDALPSVKWSYPEILRATDLLEALMTGIAGPDAGRRMSALRGYMAYQAKYDEQLKFKQIDLQNSIIDLFVDVPASVVISRQTRRYRRKASNEAVSIEEQIVDAEVVEGDDDVYSDGTDKSPGALQTLASFEFTHQFPRVVVEGAPGQGKSTVTQYLCLLHRLVLLNRHAELCRVEGLHKPTEARIPFRVDVRDYALWISGRDPFGDDPSARLPAGSNPLLECFLAAQVQRYTGSQFTVDDLIAVMKHSQVLVVLDGFDEVADVPARNRIVAEVSDAAVRIEANALSAQVVVTSRPAAFANSPGFPSENWPHMQILSLSNSSISTYAEKWLDGRGVEYREKQKVIGELQEKLRQAHVRDLARNPMQLAILLALISVQGASLPDKRTALYDQYINIFLNREAEKSSVVRDHRELLVHIHQHLAWVLQVDAEANSGPGHMAEARLRDEVREFLERRGHPTALVDELFSGMIERVVALVSRVQGTYEFEVQPLREYFAARYLRDTAPYDPPGTPRRGTLLERFDAVARNFYWLNVARFLAGCYGSGELPSLLFGLSEISKSEQFRYISHVPQLSMALLSDYVFNQQPKLALELAARVTQEHDLRLLLANRYPRRADGPLTLPTFPARHLLVEACKRLVSTAPPSDVLSAASDVLAANCTAAEILDYWKCLRTFLPSGALVSVGRRWGILAGLSAEDRDFLYDHHRAEFSSELVALGEFGIFEASPERWGRFLADAFDDPDTFGAPSQRQIVPNGRAIHAACFAATFSEETYFEAGDSRENWPLYRAIRSQSIMLFVEYMAAQPLSEVRDADLIAPREFYASIIDFFNQKVETARTSIAPWTAMIESARSIWGDRWAFYRMAIYANGIVGARLEGPPAEYSLLDQKKSLCDRVAYAHYSRDQKEWWENELTRATNVEPTTQQFVLLALFRFAPFEHILSMAGIIGELLDGLPAAGWSALASAIPNPGIRRMARAFMVQPALDPEDMPASVPPRLASILVMRQHRSVGRVMYERFLSGYRGTDREVLLSILQVVVHWAYREPERWATALPEIAHAYRHGVLDQRAHYTIYANRERGRLLPLAIARDICAHPTAYPLRLVGIAEARLAKQTGEEAIPVGKVAARDEWFVAD